MLEFVVANCELRGEWFTDVRDCCDDDDDDNDDDDDDDACNGWLVTVP